MSEILRFNINIPAEVALRYGEGKRVQGRYGEQVMYTLADNRVMYVPVCVADRIGELQVWPRAALRDLQGGSPRRTP